MKNGVVVLFANELPKKGSKWWEQFDTLVASKKFESLARQYKLTFIDIESILDPGSVQEASELVRKLSLLKTSDGRRLSKIINYRGFELWWIHYDDLMYKYCLPYTEHHKLLKYLRDFSYICLYNPPSSSLFRYYLQAHSLKHQILNTSSKKLPPLGIIIQVVLSFPFLLWLIMRRPRLMVWTSDLFDPPRDFDFRMRFIYEELKKKKIKFVEFIRSMESSQTVVSHALKRKRPVIYSFAINKLTYYLANILDKKYKKKLSSIKPQLEDDPINRFWFGVASSYIYGTSGDIWSIRVIKLILKFIGVKVAIVPAAHSRNFHEVLACKLSKIPTVGILHGVPSKNYPVYDFMPEFDGEKTLSVDKYGVWSLWWKEYYLKNSRAYRSNQMFVSGPMRPLQHTDSYIVPTGQSIKVLFASEQLASPKEILPYLVELMATKDIFLYYKFRPYRDGFEEWLKINRPDILKRMDTSKIMRGSMAEAIAQCDVVVGSHTGGVLEALLQLKPMIFFLTKKWGDYFELKSFELGRSFIAENPQELLTLIRKSKDISEKTLKELQFHFFGDPYMNGSKWVVNEIEKLL